jgi:hypothetical protein
MKTAMRQIPRSKEGKRLSGAMAVAALVSTGMLISQVALSADPVYSVVSPLGDVTLEMMKMGPRLSTLSGKTVCMVSNNAFKVNITMPAIGKALQERYPGLKVVPYQEMPPAPSVDDWDKFPGIYKSKGCDAVISGNGG